MPACSSAPASRPSVASRIGLPADGSASGPLDGKIHARASAGRFTRWRWALVWLTQLFFYGAPWLEMHGRQALLFDLANQRFYLFGLVMYPQDLIYLAGLLILSALLLFLATTLAGRVWCGFNCPQTVYTEMFMWIEHRTEGDRLARMRLDAAPWGGAKIARRGGKHAAWVALSLATGFTFVGYFTPIRSLAGGAGPWDLFWMLAYGLFTYVNAGLLREKFCKFMCPYSRFQGSLLDPDSPIVAYDFRRGEPRGARSRSAQAGALGLGACVDCTMCVQVCPTGIDIRKGPQLECIGCAVCIDACDTVMDKMQYPRGLIRFATQRELEQGRPAKRPPLRTLRRPRVLVYGGLLLVVAAAMAWSLAHRPPLRFDVIRDRGVMARQVEDGAVENVYRLQLMNATEEIAHYRIRALGIEGLRLASAAEVVLAPAERRSIVLSVRLDGATAARLAGRIEPVRFAVSPAGNARAVAGEEESTFVVPR